MHYPTPAKLTTLLLLFGSAIFGLGVSRAPFIAARSVIRGVSQASYDIAMERINTAGDLFTERIELREAIEGGNRECARSIARHILAEALSGPKGNQPLPQGISVEAEIGPSGRLTFSCVEDGALSRP